MRVAVLSDIHSNLCALDAVLESLGSVDAIWQLGDVVGYGPEPDGVVEKLREVGAIGVRGNHDAAVCGREPLESFNPDARTAAEWTRAGIARATADYLASLPEFLTPAGTDFTLVHGSPRDPTWEYLTSSLAARENLEVLGTRSCLVGHTHMPIAFRERDGHVHGIPAEAGSRFDLDDTRVILNPGSVGQPRDGNPTASYMILDTATGYAMWRRVAYDVDSTQTAMLAAGLPPRLARRLSFGH